MDKEVIGSASAYNKKYYFNPTYAQLPYAVQQKIKQICLSGAEKLHGIFSIGFYQDGSLFFETRGVAGALTDHADDAPLLVADIKREEKDFLKALQLWHTLYQTEAGKCAKDALLPNG